MRSVKGFSLVELSIVLVILGLLTGGILSGQSLIRAAELRSLVTEYQRYTTGIQTFRDKYFALPGDMTNATAFWGTDPNGCPSNSVQTTRIATCNGNGDGKIGTYSIYDAAGMSESFRAMQQLADAGLIEGQYTGVTGTRSASDAVPGLNIPRSKISQVGWSYTYMFPDGAFVPMMTGETSNVLLVGLEADGAGLNDGPPLFLKPEEAWNVDTKTDDGLPNTGKTRGTFMNNGCSTGATTSATYALSNTSNTLCGLMFIMQ